MVAVKDTLSAFLGGLGGSHAMRVEVKSEQMSLESFVEDGKWCSCPDIGQEQGCNDTLCYISINSH